MSYRRWVGAMLLGFPGLALAHSQTGAGAVFVTGLLHLAGIAIGLVSAIAARAALPEHWWRDDCNRWRRAGPANARRLSH